MSEEKGLRGIYRKTMGESNRQNILKQLAKEDLAFNELKQRLGWKSSTVLSTHLKEMINNNEIFQIPDKIKRRFVYSASVKTIIRELIIPELLYLIGINTLATITIARIEGKEEIRDPPTGFNVNNIFTRFIPDKYSRHKITPQDVWEILNDTPEYEHYIRTSLEDW